MTRPLTDWTLGELLDRTASAEPTPSAGSVAAVSAALGLGLVAMGFAIAAKRGRRGKPLPSLATAEDLTAWALSAQELAQSLLRLADDDQAAVRAFLRASRAAGREVADQALVRATEIPLTMAGLIRDGLTLADEAARVAPAAVRADVAAGALLLGAALNAMRGSVTSNLSLLPDDERHASLVQAARETAGPDA